MTSIFMQDMVDLVYDREKLRFYNESFCIFERIKTAERHIKEACFKILQGSLKFASTVILIILKRTVKTL